MSDASRDGNRDGKRPSPLRRDGCVSKSSRGNWLDPIAQRCGWVQEKLVDQVDFDTDPNRMMNCGYWAGCVVGHWCMGPLGMGTTRREHPCISLCGVIAFYRPDEIASGRLPKTCFGCRPGEHAAPPRSRVMSEGDLKEFLEYVKRCAVATVFEENGSLSGQAKATWDKLGREVLSWVASLTGYGAGFGWKCYVKGCQYIERATEVNRVYLQEVQPSRRCVRLKVRPARGHYIYDVDLTTGRTDHDFHVIADKIKEAVFKIEEDANKKELDAAVKEAKVAAVANGNHANGQAAQAPDLKPFDVAAVDRLMAKMEKAKGLAKDLNDMAVEKARAEQELERARSHKEACEERKQKSMSACLVASREYSGAKSVVEELESKLKNAKAVYDEKLKAKAEAEVEVQAAERALKEANERLAKAEQEAKDCHRLEEERIKEVGEGRKIMDLLTALKAMAD